MKDPPARREQAAGTERKAQMKKTGVCPKCGGRNILKVEPMRCNAFPIGFTTLAKLERWFCGSCGFTEEWIQEADLEKAVKFWAEPAQ